MLKYFRGKLGIFESLLIDKHILLNFPACFVNDTKSNQTNERDLDCGDFACGECGMKLFITNLSLYFYDI